MKAFTVKPSKADLRQLYVNAPAHAWVKARAEESGAKMTDVVDSLIDYVDDGRKETTKLVDLVFDLAEKLQLAGGLTDSLNARLDEVDKIYGDTQDAD